MVYVSFFQRESKLIIIDSIGPVAQFHENSKYYSAIAPKPNKQVDNNLPHVTVQMPVYKESLTAVL